MVRTLVRHEQFGEGRVLASGNGQLRIVFFGADGADSEQIFAQDAITRGFLTPVLLEKGRRCQGPGGACAVVRPTAGGRTGWRSYEVLYESGISSVCSEDELEPVPSFSLPTPSSNLAVRQIHHLVEFRNREAFRAAHIQNLRQGGQLSALLSARIDLHPHQAFVAGTVLDDRRRRYILADEVGLGKTIEAGVIIHDLLTGSSKARILIVCPGPLTQQWLCELYSKFGGQVFTLIDLHSEAHIKWNLLRQVIVSMSQVLQFAAEPLLRSNWDLVIIDECHHLLSTPVLYAFARELSRKTRSFLLLSAIPAQQKEEEYFKLLALLEPDKFDPASADAINAFKILFDGQNALSRRLQPLIIRTHGLQNGDYTVEDVIRQAGRLLELPILTPDTQLQKLHQRLVEAQSGQAGISQQIVDHVADRYRIYRRILRNRRKALQKESKIDIVTRHRELHAYQPGERERDALAAVDTLLSVAWKENPENEVIVLLARALWQSVSSSDCALELLQPMINQPEGILNKEGRDFLALGHVIGYDDWSLYIDLLRTAAGSLLRRDLLHDAITALTLWSESGEQAARYRHFSEFLRKYCDGNRGAKVLVFAGYPGLAEEVEIAIGSLLGESAVVSFRADMPREGKEDAATRFRSDAGIRLLISDETGGEGRNFEFADVVIHYDTPWQASRIEQRIGRLDRIGRTRYRTDVRSSIFYPEGSIEEAVVRCYDEGLNVYQDSISGLEFSLKEQELNIVKAALRGSVDALSEFTPILKQAALEERSRDEYDALLDWASFNEDRAQKFLNVRARPEVESSVERTFVEYYRSIARTKAASPYSDEKTSEGLWRFELDGIKSGVMSSDSGGEIIGTFRRDIAQTRLDRAFLQVGNPFFDAIANAVQHYPSFRTYAVQCRNASTPPWHGFEFVYSCEPNLDVLRDRLDLINFAKSFFSSVPVHIFIDFEGREGDSSSLRVLRQSLGLHNKAKVWMNLWRDRESVLDSLLERPAWAALVAELEVKARVIASTRLTDRLSSLGETTTRWSAQSRRFRDQGTAISVEEAATLELLVKALTDWRVQQESAGFLSVNRELARYA
jgi:ATP-dependent helicase HepA